MANTLHNPVRDQDRAEDLLDNWRKYSYVMFPQQAAIYHRLKEQVRDKLVLEAGCGAGIGSAILNRTAGFIRATDKSQRNVDFARELYPWMTFDVWDVGQPWHGRRAECVVCVEALEHVADPLVAIKHLLAAAIKEVWISTPNGRGKPRPPENPFHVCEYTPVEMIEMLAGYKVDVLHWETFQPVGLDTDVNPLVYKVVL